MISYQEALNIISSHSFGPSSEEVDILEANGRVLAEDIVADRDLPPYDRVTMDGIAINFAAFAAGQRDFEVLETIGAGVAQKAITQPNKCVQIMTGAIMPTGLDTVIRYEDIFIKDGVAEIQVDSIKKKQNIHFKGEDRKSGEVVLAKGKRLGAAELIVAAAVGRSQLMVAKLPKAAIITTGDELVDINEKPLEHQVRRSSNYGVHALMKQWGVDVDQYHLADDKTLLKREIENIIKTYKLIILTGGISRGKFDFLPEVLEELGVQKHFHKVKQRPGKPFWFGTNDQVTVFALPGNPVSSFVCANVYIRHWLAGSLDLPLSNSFAQLTANIEFDRPLTYFIESKVTNTSGVLKATPIKGNGSGDFDNLTAADGFLVLPEEKNEFFAGEVYPYIPYRNTF